MRDRVDEDATERRQVASTLGERRHSRIRVERTARVVAGVIEKEKCSGVVHELADDEGTSEGCAETLLQIVRIRCGSIQWVRRGIQRRRVEALKDGAANLIAAAASAERSAGASRAEPASAEPARAAAGGSATARTRTAGIVRRGIAEPVAEPKRSAKSPGPLGPKNPAVA